MVYALLESRVQFTHKLNTLLLNLSRDHVNGRLLHDFAGRLKGSRSQIAPGRVELWMHRALDPQSGLIDIYQLQDHLDRNRVANEQICAIWGFSAQQQEANRADVHKEDEEIEFVRANQPSTVSDVPSEFLTLEERSERQMAYIMAESIRDEEKRKRQNDASSSSDVIPMVVDGEDDDENGPAKSSTSSSSHGPRGVATKPNLDRGVATATLTSSSFALSREAEESELAVVGWIRRVGINRGLAATETNPHYIDGLKDDLGVLLTLLYRNLDGASLGWNNVLQRINKQHAIDEKLLSQFASLGMTVAIYNTTTDVSTPLSGRLSYVFGAGDVYVTTLTKSLPRVPTGTQGINYQPLLERIRRNCAYYAEQLHNTKDSKNRDERKWFVEHANGELEDLLRTMKNDVGWDRTIAAITHAYLFNDAFMVRIESRGYLVGIKSGDTTTYHNEHTQNAYVAKPGDTYVVQEPSDRVRHDLALYQSKSSSSLSSSFAGSRKQTGVRPLIRSELSHKMHIIDDNIVAIDALISNSNRYKHACNQLKTQVRILKRSLDSELHYLLLRLHANSGWTNTMKAINEKGAIDGVLIKRMRKMGFRIGIVADKITIDIDGEDGPYRLEENDAFVIDRHWPRTFEGTREPPSSSSAAAAAAAVQPPQSASSSAAAAPKKTGAPPAIEEKTNEVRPDSIIIGIAREIVDNQNEYTRLSLHPLIEIAGAKNALNQLLGELMVRAQLASGDYMRNICEANAMEGVLIKRMRALGYRIGIGSAEGAVELTGNERELFEFRVDFDGAFIVESPVRSAFDR